jgi:hypothetical protein
MAEQNEIEVLKSLIIALKDSFDNFKENVAVKFEDLLAEAAIRKESRAISLLRSDVSPQNNYSSGEEVGGQLLNFTNSPSVVPPGDKMFWAPSVEFKRKSDAMDAKWCGSKPDDVLDLIKDESHFLDLLETHHPELYRLRLVEFNFCFDRFNECISCNILLLLPENFITRRILCYLSTTEIC